MNICLINIYPTLPLHTFSLPLHTSIFLLLPNRNKRLHFLSSPLHLICQANWTNVNCGQWVPLGMWPYLNQWDLGRAWYRLLKKFFLIFCKGFKNIFLFVPLIMVNGVMKFTCDEWSKNTLHLSKSVFNLFNIRIDKIDFNENTNLL